MRKRELKQDRTVPHSSRLYRDEWESRNLNRNAIQEAVYA
jgi:hypothetical protein